MNFIKDMLSNSNNVSAMRVMALISLLTSIGMALAGKPNFEPFLYTAFAAKVAQKGMEKATNP